MDGPSFVFGMVAGAVLALFSLFIIGSSGVLDESDEFNAFIKVCPQYDVGFYNDKYKLSGDKGMLEVTPHRYSKLTGNMN